ncbi:MAG: KamA family radical SAM protein [Verrucomicrobia bacterium]|nr:KamA family radical SAM protein [Verrucomicrobiota bacterium]MBS0636774.1 KamA family radical SAM protein [Verrucomicrobiota bacterium]
MNWRTVLRQNFVKFPDLAAFLELSQESLDAIDQNPRFSLNLPRRLAEKMAKNCLTDPLFLQFVPLKKELIVDPSFTLDPVKDSTFQLTDKLLKKYEGRALVIATSACAMHCRFCFRKNFDYQTEDKTFAHELDVIKNNPTIEEVILSGGDPLSLSDEVLGPLLEKLSQISHLKRIRFHSRFLMGIPERVDDGFLSLLRDYPKQIWFINHANHLNEFDDEIWKALKSIQKLGIPILNQAVLLAGVNDNHDTLKALFSSLVDNGITPYYLHQLDEVQGSSHFKVDPKEGLKLISSLMGSLSGYAVPKYVQEIPNRSSKTVVS